MRIRYSWRVLVLAALAACNGDPRGYPPTSPPPPAPPVLLQDIVIPSLPSPYYHFEYDADGRVTLASFASGLRQYDVRYTDGRISELQNNAVLNGDRLQYTYDDAGRVVAVKYVNASGVVFTTLFLTYEGPRLTKLERDRRVDGGFIIDKTMTLTYYADGNVQEITEHHPQVVGEQDETTTVDRFEQYDDKINVDGFSLIHDEFFDHLVLLPGVHLQVGNPARQTHTGDGVNYTVGYSYSYDDKNRPRSKSGSVTFLNGPDTGKQFQTSSIFSYY